MTDSDALISGAFALVSAGVYAFVGWRLYRRQVSPEARLPATQFGIFWLGLALVSAVQGVESLVAAFTLPSLAVALTVFYVELLLLCGILWGLVGYLTYLFTGRSYLLPISALYAVLFVLLVYSITASGPIGVTLSQGTVGLQYTTAIVGPMLAVLTAVLVLPEFIGSVLYFTLFFRTRDRTVRYRVAVVSWSLIAWFGLSLLNIGNRLGGGVAAQIFARSLGVLAGIAILLAYYPPRVWRERFGLRGIDDVAGTPA